MPGEKDPTQAISTCPYCNSCVDQKAQKCQNCGKVITPKWGNPFPRKVPQKHERYQDYGPKFDYVSPSVPVSASSKIARKKKDRDFAKHDKDTVREEYISDEFSMCLDPKRKRQQNVDRKLEVMRSCRDLEIDG